MNTYDSFRNDILEWNDTVEEIRTGNEGFSVRPENIWSFLVLKLWSGPKIMMSGLIVWEGRNNEILKNSTSYLHIKFFF